MNFGANNRKSVGRTATSLEPPKTRCTHCGRTMNDFAGGSSRGLDGKPLCHPNGPNRPNCYKLVTNYGHATPCTKKKCYEDHPRAILDYIGRTKVRV